MPSGWTSSAACSTPGYGDRVVLSHDICTKHRLAAYGGHGYGHLLAEVVPWMRQRGFTAAETTA